MSLVALFKSHWHGFSHTPGLPGALVDLGQSHSGITPELVRHKRRRVIAGFPFHREFALLDERLRLSAGVIDCMILVESTYTQNGLRKRLYFNESKAKNPNFYASTELFTLVHVIDDSGNYFNSGGGIDGVWAQEQQPRRMISRGLQSCGSPAEDDILVISDADEILVCICMLLDTACLMPPGYAVPPRH